MGVALLNRWVAGAVAGVIGEVASVVPVRTGFTPGTKVLVRASDGGLYFVKSAPESSWVADEYRREAQAHVWLPAAASGSLLLAHLTVAEHQTLVFRGLRDRRPGATTWRGRDELRDALRALSRAYADIDDAAPDDLPSSLDGFWSRRTFWRRCAVGRESPSATTVDTGMLSTFAALEDSALFVLRRPGWSRQVSHEDLRRDQFVIEEDGTGTVVDWNWVTRTPRIGDATYLAVGVEASGLDPDAVFDDVGPYGRFELDDLSAVLAALSGYFYEAARDRTGKPASLVLAQARYARASTRWLGRLIAARP